VYQPSDILTTGSVVAIRQTKGDAGRGSCLGAPWRLRLPLRLPPALAIAVSLQHSDRPQGSPLAPGRTWALKEAQRSSRTSVRRSPSR